MSTISTNSTRLSVFKKQLGVVPHFKTNELKQHPRRQTGKIKDKKFHSPSPEPPEHKNNEH